MRHSIAVKFIAVLLAALALFTAIGSGAAIIGLVATDLYENSVEELYNESMQSTRQNFAVNLAHRYASLNLGELPEQYLNDYYGLNWMYNTFQYGYFYYTIRNEHGDVVESTMAEAPEGGTRYEMAVTDIRFRALVEILPEETETFPASEAMEPTQPPETVPETSVSETTVSDVTVPQEASEAGTIPDTTASADPTEAVEEGTEPSATTETAAEWEAPTEAPVDSTDAVMAYEMVPEIHYDSYYDYELERYVEFTFVYEDLPPYTVDLYLLPGALPEEYAWTIIRQVWTYRYELFYVLGISLLAFAVLLVYLCCAAGRKSGREEVRAGGLNCMPLDLYALGGGVTIFFALFFSLEVAEYLMRYSPQVLAPYVVLAGYACCLIFVGFCFACAAQFKTPGGYWWRNSICGRGLRALVWLWNHFISGCVWLADRMPPVLGRIFRKLWNWTGALMHWFGGVCVILWSLAAKCARYLWERFKKLCIWFGGKLARFYGLIPLTWQWLLTAFAMLFLAFLAFGAHSGGWLLLSLGLYLAIVIYGTSAFGILMESAKRMSKGDLETKVSDQFLVGSFKEFAGDLNALADVAVVAAQKQLKSERMKTELITNVSHDIKTPLTSIINYVDLLQKPHTPEEQEVYLEVLSRQSLQLKKLIEDLMEMSKASTGNMTVDITAVNAGEAINQALGEFADKLAKVQLIPVFRQPEEPIYMKADGRLAWRVLSNLLSNAYKYALPGTRLYIDLMELEGKVIISMKNISREELNVSADELLERFVRGDASRNTEGSGLGLNIAQSLMELQKGQLQLLVDGDLFKVTLVFPAA